VVDLFNGGIVISQRKYVIDIFEETYLLNAKLVDTHMDPNVKLLPNQGSIYQIREDDWLKN